MNEENKKNVLSEEELKQVSAGKGNESQSSNGSCKDKTTEAECIKLTYCVWEENKCEMAFNAEPLGKTNNALKW